MDDVSENKLVVSFEWKMSLRYLKLLIRQLSTKGNSIFSIERHESLRLSKVTVQYVMKRRPLILTMIYKCPLTEVISDHPNIKDLVRASKEKLNDIILLPILCVTMDKAGNNYTKNLHSIVERALKSPELCSPPLKGLKLCSPTHGSDKPFVTREAI